MLTFEQNILIGRDIKITKAQSITTHISNTQLYYIAFRSQLGTKRLHNNNRVKFFLQKTFEKNVIKVLCRGENGSVTFQNSQVAQNERLGVGFWVCSPFFLIML